MSPCPDPKGIGGHLALWWDQVSAEPEGASGGAQLRPASARSPSPPSFLPSPCLRPGKPFLALRGHGLILAPAPSGGRKPPASLISPTESRRGFKLSCRMSKNRLNETFFPPLAEGVHLHPHRAGRRADGQRLLGALLPRARHPGRRDHPRPQGGQTHGAGGRASGFVF